MSLILGQARPKKLHKGHGLPTTRAWVRLHRPTPGGWCWKGAPSVRLAFSHERQSHR